MYQWGNQKPKIEVRQSIAKQWSTKLQKQSKHDPHKTSMVNSGDPGEYAVLASLVTPVVLVWLNIFWQFMKDEMEDEIMTTTNGIRYIHGHLWHRYSIAVNQVMKFRSDDFHLITRNHWCSSFLDDNNFLSSKSL
jgi:hypothetical protein